MNLVSYSHEDVEGVSLDVWSWAALTHLRYLRNSVFSDGLRDGKSMCAHGGGRGGGKVYVCVCVCECVCVCMCVVGGWRRWATNRHLKVDIKSVVLSGWPLARLNKNRPDTLPPMHMWRPDGSIVHANVLCLHAPQGWCSRKSLICGEGPSPSGTNCASI